MRELRVRLIGRLLYGLWLRYPWLRDQIDARLVRFFSRRAAQWDETTGAMSSTRLGVLESALAQLSAHPRRAADVGTGTGAGALLLAHRYPTAWIEGIDPSGEMLAAARAKANQRGVAVRFAGGTADALPLKSGSTDLLTYVNAPVDFLEASRVLRQGGALIVCFTSGDNTPFYARPHTLRRLTKRAGLVCAGAAGAADGEYFVAFKQVPSAAGRPPDRPLVETRREQIALIAHVPGAATEADSTQPFERPAELLIARRRRFRPFAATSPEAVQKAARQAAARGELSVACGDDACAARVFLGVAGSSAPAAWLPGPDAKFAYELGLVDDSNSVADLLTYGVVRDLGAIGLGGDALAFHFAARPIDGDRGPRAELRWPDGGATLYCQFEAISAHRDASLPEGVLIRPLVAGKQPNAFEPFVVTDAEVTFHSAWEFEADGEPLVRRPTEFSYRPAMIKLVAPVPAYAR